MRPRPYGPFAAAVGLFLAGPVIWFGHFMAVYLFAEVACHAGGIGSALGLPVVTLVTVVATLLAVLPTWWLARRAWRARGDEHGELAFIGALLGLLFALTILFVGLPPLFLQPC